MPGQSFPGYSFAAWAQRRDAIADAMSVRRRVFIKNLPFLEIKTITESRRLRTYNSAEKPDWATGKYRCTWIRQYKFPAQNVNFNATWRMRAAFEAPVILPGSPV